MAKVDEVGKTFHIVVLNTTMTVAHTSVSCSLIANIGTSSPRVPLVGAS
jgi:hypothetical protein